MTGKDAGRKAQLRLAATGRKCDGCGRHIGRFTGQCAYDAKFDRVYCSTGGCAARVSGVLCRRCRKPVNPFEDPDIVTFPAYGGVETFCGACRKAAPPTALPKGSTPVAIPGTLPPAIAEAVGAGPYVVVESSHGWFQVVLPKPGGKPFCRASTSDRTHAFLRCAEFNRGVPHG